MKPACASASTARCGRPARWRSSKIERTDRRRSSRRDGHRRTRGRAILATGKTTAARKDIVFGAAIAGAGLYFILVGAGVLPPPGGPDNMHAPPAVILCIGLVIGLGGIGVIIQGVGRGDRQGMLAADAPPWLRLAQDLIGVLMFGLFAIIGSWIAIAGDARQFSATGMPLKFASGVSLGRVVFGLGALICLAITIAAAARFARTLRRRHRA